MKLNPSGDPLIKITCDPFAMFVDYYVFNLDELPELCGAIPRLVQLDSMIIILIANHDWTFTGTRYWVEGFTSGISLNPYSLLFMCGETEASRG